MNEEALRLLVAVGVGDWAVLMDFLPENANRQEVARGLIYAKEAMGLPPSGKFVVTSPHVLQVVKDAWATLPPDLVEKIATEAPEEPQEENTDD